MALFDERKLEKRATKVVDDFFNEKRALTEGVTDVAEQDNLNPEQVKRLTEAVNNAAFLRKFEGANDRMEASQFEPADAQAALGRMLDAAKDLMVVTEGQGEMPDTSGEELPITRPEVEPLNPASAEEMAAVQHEPKLSSAVMTMRLRKTAQELSDQTYQAKYAFTEEFEKLVTGFTKVGCTDFSSFELDAFYKWGDDAVTPLKMLRQSLRMPAMNYDSGARMKMARVIDSGTPEMQRFQRLLKAAHNYRSAHEGQEKVAGYLDQLKG